MIYIIAIKLNINLNAIRINQYRSVLEVGLHIFLYSLL